MHVETHQHEIKHIGFTEDARVVITFHNDPFDGELILSPDTFESLYQQWDQLRTRELAYEPPQHEGAEGKCGCEIDSNRNICKQGFVPQPHMQEACDNPDPTNPRLKCGHSRACHEVKP